MSLDDNFVLDWEERALQLDERGVSEQYFPIWGFLDVQHFLSAANAHRQELEDERAAALAAEREEEERRAREEREQERARELEILRQQAEVQAQAAARVAASQLPPEVAHPSLAKRAAWTLGAIAGRVLLIVLVSLLLTFVVNLLASGQSFAEYTAGLLQRIQALF